MLWSLCSRFALPCTNYALKNLNLLLASLWQNMAGQHSVSLSQCDKKSLHLFRNKFDFCEQSLFWESLAGHSLFQSIRRSQSSKKVQKCLPRSHMLFPQFCVKVAHGNLEGWTAKRRVIRRRASLQQYCFVNLFTTKKKRDTVCKNLFPLPVIICCPLLGKGGHGKKCGMVWKLFYRSGDHAWCF